MLTAFIFFSFYTGIFAQQTKCGFFGLPSPVNPNKCYYFSDKGLNFASAEEKCQQYGGHLASVCNAFENQALSTAANQEFTSYGIKDFWIGWNDMINKDQWNWTDPNAGCTSYTNWNTGHPSDDCTTMSISDGTWQSMDCGVNKPFVCEQIMLPTTPANQNSCREGYTYFSIWNACYKLVRTNYPTWQDAENNCINEGGHLVSIHSVEENEFIDDMIHQIGTWAVVWIGFNNHCGDWGITTPNCWMWSDGSPITFTDWIQGFPINVTQGGSKFSRMISSRSIYNNGTAYWDNYAVDSRPSICKQNPICA